MQDAQLISQAGQVESLASDGLVSVSTGAGQPQKNMELAKFADSLGSSVPLQQSSEQVSITGLYARTSDGKMVELTKESVASVMAGIMNTNKLFPFMGRGYLKGSANDLYGKNKAGIYTVSYYNEPNFSDLPEGVSYGTLSVLADTNFSTQILSSVTNTSYYIRYRSDTAWGAWQRIDNFGYNSLAELSSGVAEQMGVLYRTYTTESGGDITTNINVNLGYFGGTIIGIASSHSSIGNATASEIKMIRCGYDGNNVEEAVVSSLIKNANSGASIASYRANQDGYLVINVNVRIARIKLFLF
jgi:hypothetical protein